MCAWGGGLASAGRRQFGVTGQQSGGFLRGLRGLARALLFGLFPQQRFLRDGEHLADGVVKALCFRVAGYLGGR